MPSGLPVRLSSHPLTFAPQDIRSTRWSKVALCASNRRVIVANWRLEPYTIGVTFWEVSLVAVREFSIIGTAAR